jgi:hypothetical protein
MYFNRMNREGKSSCGRRFSERTLDKVRCVVREKNTFHLGAKIHSNEMALQVLVGQKAADHVERLLGTVLRHHVTGCV